MIRDIFEEMCIYHYAFVPTDILSPANRRLYSQIPDGCSAVFVLFPYYVSSAAFPLSRFAAVYDYHTLSSDIFRRVCAYIENKYPGAYAKGYSDHSPYCERDGAAAAGLGIVGDNGLLINHEYSSFVCIGEIVTSLGEKELNAEGIPAGDGKIRHCESCGACRAACPGGCAGTDSRVSCASALNQKKSVLTDEEAHIVRSGGYLWGCDICQNVCPHTIRAIERGSIETPISFFRDSVISNDAFSAIADMSDEEYKKYPFSWRKREIMERNIEILKSGGSKR